LTEGVHGISAGQDVVGTTSTQTLTNKTLTAPTINAGTATLLTALSIAIDVDMGDYQVRAKQFYADVPQGTAPFIVASTTLVTNLNADKLDGKDGPAGAIVGTTDTQELTNKTLTSAVLNGTISGSAVKDEDLMTSDSPTAVATQQSIKAYVDRYPAELLNLTQAEVQQLENIGATTISAAQWGYLGALDQDVSQSGTPTFAGITINGPFAGTGVLDEDDMASDSATKVATQQSIKAYADKIDVFALAASDTLTADSYVEFTSLSASKIYILELRISSFSADAALQMTFNGDDTSGNYIWNAITLLDTYPGSNVAGEESDHDDGFAKLTSNSYEEGEITIKFHQINSTTRVGAKFESFTRHIDTTSYYLAWNGYATWDDSEALSSIRITMASGNMTGTALLYSISLP